MSEEAEVYASEEGLEEVSGNVTSGDGFTFNAVPQFVGVFAALDAEGQGGRGVLECETRFLYGEMFKGEWVALQDTEFSLQTSSTA